MLIYHHVHSQTHNFISITFICKCGAEHLEDCGPQNSWPSLFPISGERSSSILVALDLPCRKDKKNSTDYPITCITKCCLLSHCNKKQWSVATWDHLTQLYFLSHLVYLHRKWEDCCLSYKVWLFINPSLSTYDRQNMLFSLGTTYSISSWKVARITPLKCLPSRACMKVELYYFHLKNAKHRKQRNIVPGLCGCRLMKQSKLHIKLEKPVTKQKA